MSELAFPLPCALSGAGIPRCQSLNNSSTPTHAPPTQPPTPTPSPEFVGALK